VLLDFKRATSPLGGKVRDDRGNFARALSGFANSSGGVLIWGIDARRGREHQEVAIPAPEAFVQELETWLPVAVTRAVDGVENFVIDADRGTGFVVSYVPESPSAPHRAEFGLRQYFRRVGDSFKSMEHYELEDMFGRRQRPVLDLQVSFLKESITPDVHRYRLQVRVANRGRAMALHYKVDVEFPAEILDSPAAHALGDFRLTDDQAAPGFVILSARNDVLGPLFPGETVQLTPRRGSQTVDYVLNRHRGRAGTTNRCD
jgi:Schlafen, AlbA_2